MIQNIWKYQRPSCFTESVQNSAIPRIRFGALQQSGWAEEILGSIEKICQDIFSDFTLHSVNHIIQLYHIVLNDANKKKFLVDNV